MAGIYQPAKALWQVFDYSEPELPWHDYGFGLFDDDDDDIEERKALEDV